MKTLLTFLLVALVACGGGDVTAPGPDPLPTLLPGEGVLRFTLATNCPQMTLAFGVDIFWYGPETLSPGKYADYSERAGTYVTRGKTFPTATTTFAQESITVVAGQRVVRVLSC